jgi:hypothetical protein
MTVIGAGINFSILLNVLLHRGQLFSHSVPHLLADVPHQKTHVDIQV